MQDIKEIANIVSTLVNLPAFMITNGNVEIIRTGILSNTPINRIRGLLFTKQFTQDVKDKSAKVPILLRYVNSLGLSFLVTVVSLDPLTTVLMGPFFLEERDGVMLIGLLCEMKNSPLDEYAARSLVEAIETKDTLFIQAWGQTMSRFLGLPTVSYVKISTIREKAIFRKEIPTIAENRMDEAEITAHYQFERELKQLVRQGNRERLRKLLLPKTDKDLQKARLNPVFQRRAKGSNTLRIEKNLILTLSTLFRQSVDDAGLPPIYIHSISEEINSKIERADSTDTLLGVVELMIDSYCNSINNVSLQNHSVNIVKVKRYIVNNIDKKITLTELSELTNLDESYLCRLFKRECRMTINEYIRTQRINEAKWLLESSDKQIMEIAHMLGFSSQSYFCAVFKKLVGVSPASYRLNHGNYYRPES